MAYSITRTFPSPSQALVTGFPELSTALVGLCSMITNELYGTVVDIHRPANANATVLALIDGQYEFYVIAFELRAVQ